MKSPRRICFVTGTRAEFGLMRSTLRAIKANEKLQLQLVVTGMHLRKKHGRSIDTIRDEGWPIDAVVPWPTGDGGTVAQARATGIAMAAMAKVFARLESEIILVVGDRVEAFAAASVGAIAQRVVAHVHGGDRAEGQVDDSLRHAITKLSHVHFAATAGSAQRIERLGEDHWRIHTVGAPGLDGIRKEAARTADLQKRFPNLRARRFALVLLHPVTADDAVESKRAAAVLDGLRAAGVAQCVVIYPNTDPGGAGIVHCWRDRRGAIAYLLPDVPRGLFLALMRDCGVMVGNSSAGIIEAGAFGTPVVNIGPRQAGRERGRNVVDASYQSQEIARAVERMMRPGRRTMPDKSHPYGGGRAGAAIAKALAKLNLADARLTRKCIAY
jgi:GDP/UDP-N,N'-diacetylbacillosamine 2-epimerase (hydrolysing)